MRSTGAGSNRIHLATSLVVRERCVLLVASTYPNHSKPLWNLPGGRQAGGETLVQTALRELHEETALRGTPKDLVYVSESFDGPTHFTNVTFCVAAAGEPRVPAAEADHVVDVRWVPFDEVEDIIEVRVVREPLVAALCGGTRRYWSYAKADISVVFPD